MNRSNQSLRQRSVVTTGFALLLMSCSAWAGHKDFCDGKPLDVNYRNPHSCETYVSCGASGVASVGHCPPGLQFTEAERPWGYCDYPEHVRCVTPPPGARVEHEK